MLKTLHSEEKQTLSNCQPCELEMKPLIKAHTLTWCSGPDSQQLRTCRWRLQPCHKVWFSSPCGGNAWTRFLCQSAKQRETTSAWDSQLVRRLVCVADMLHRICWSEWLSASSNRAIFLFSTTVCSGHLEQDLRRLVHLLIAFWKFKLHKPTAIISNHLWKSRADWSKITVHILEMLDSALV